MKVRIIAAVAAAALAFGTTAMAEDVTTASTGGVLGEMEISGVIEVEAYFANEKYDVADDNAASDIEVATFDLAVEAKVADKVNAAGVFTYSDGDDVTADEAYITYENGPYGLMAGLFYMPFGNYTSSMLTSPITCDLGETSDSGAKFSADLGIAVVEAFAFNGDAERGNGDDDVNDFGVSVTAKPAEFLTIGGSFISDFADTDAELTGNVYTDRVAGLAFYALFEQDKISAVAEIVAAMDEMDDLDADADGDSDRPVAWNAEVAYQQSETLVLGAGIGGSKEFADAPMFRFGIVAGWTPWENVTLTAEAMHNEYDDDFTADLESSDVFTVQWATSF